MPKSKRSRTFHLTQVAKKTREQKEKLFQEIQATVPNYKYCFVLGFDNMRNNHLKDVRREMSDSRYVCALGGAPTTRCTADQPSHLPNPRPHSAPLVHYDIQRHVHG